MLPQLTDSILEGWGDHFHNEAKPNSIDYLGLPGSVEGGTTTFLAFGDKSKKPIFAVKIHRDLDAMKRVHNERDVLNSINTSGNQSLLSSVPRVILCKSICGRWLIVQSILEGMPMKAALDKNGNSDLETATTNMLLVHEWLVQLHSMSRNVSHTEHDNYKYNSLKQVEAFRRIFDLTQDEKVFLKKIEDDFKDVSKFGAFIKHGDLCRQNILIRNDKDGSNVGVIDWTDSMSAGPPLYDFFFFISTYYLQVRKTLGVEGFEEAFKRTFFERNSYSLMVKQQILGYCDTLRIDVRSLGTLFGIFLIEQSVFEYNKLLRFSKNGGLPRFTIYLALARNKNFSEALKEQLWIYFFRIFAKNFQTFLCV